MDIQRIQKLERNERLLFWGRSFLNLKITNAVLSLFYVARGLTDSQIIWVSMFWAGAMLLFEIPSSYMADRWGRKKTLIFGTVFGLMQWVVLLYADGFLWVALSMVCYGIWSASFSGTDIALLYDTKKELGNEHDSLKGFGMYESARNLFKIGSALVGVYLARDLTAAQFELLIGIDMIASLIAIGFLSYLTEPRHTMDLEKQEAGVFKDALSKVRKEPLMQRAIVNKVLIFLVAYILWTYYQKMYVGLGMPILFLGVGWSLYHAINFIVNRNIHVFERWYPVHTLINSSVVGYTGMLGILVVLYFFEVSVWVLYPLYVLSAVVMSLQTPLFNHYLNQFSHSYNRATTLSLTNLLHNVLEIPMLLFAGVLVARGEIYPYIFAVIIGILVLLTVRIRPVPVS